MSIGVAVFPRDGLTNADLIAGADAALYHAKKSGKNQVAMASEVVDAGVDEARRPLRHARQTADSLSPG